MAPEIVMVTAKTKTEQLVSWLVDHSTFFNDPQTGDSALLMLKTVVLVHEQRRVELVTALLAKKDFRVTGLHGGHSVTQRETVSRQFRERRWDIIVYSNGLDTYADFPMPKHVVTLDLPPSLTGNQFISSNAIFVNVESVSDMRVAPTLYNYLVVSRQQVPNWLRSLLPPAYRY